MPMLWVSQPWLAVALAMRDLAARFTLREIDTVFEPAGYVLRLEHLDREAELIDELGGRRRARAQVWLERIDWTSNPPTGLFDSLGRLAHLVASAPSGASHESLVQGLNLALAHQDLRLDMSNCRVAPIGLSLSLPNDLPGVQLELARVEAWHEGGDLLAVVGAAKNLVEATAKVVLNELDIPVNTTDSVAQLVSRAHEALGLAADAALPKALRTVLGSSSKVATSLGDLRNATAGSVGHGTDSPADWVKPAHARLVADCAVAWSRFILATFEDRTHTF